MRLFILIGLQCSGKSTFCKNIKNGVILSSDEIRLEFPDKANPEIFNILNARLEKALREKKDAYIDATNTSIKFRKQYIEIAKKFNYKVEALIFNTPIEEIKYRLEKRNNDENYSFKFDFDVIQRYLNNFQMPTYDEGFDKISLMFKNKDLILNRKNCIIKSLEFKHNDKYHGTNSVLKHCARMLSNNSNPLISKENIMLHDFGKMFAAKQSPKNPEMLCYYHHGPIGAYIFMTMLSPEEFDRFYDSLVIMNYHMLPVEGIKKDKLFSMFQKETAEKILSFSNLDTSNV